MFSLFEVYILDKYLNHSLPFFSSFSLVAFGKSVKVVTPDKSRVAWDALEPSSSELSEEVPLLVLSDLPRAALLSAMESSFDDSGSAPVPPDDCCLRLRYSDMDNWKSKKTHFPITYSASFIMDTNLKR